MTAWFRRLSSRLGPLATEDPCPEYSSMDARDGLARRPGPVAPPRLRLVSMPAAEDQPGWSETRRPARHLV